MWDRDSLIVEDCGTTVSSEYDRTTENSKRLWMPVQDPQKNTVAKIPSSGASLSPEPLGESLRMWPLVGGPRYTGWHHTYA